MNRDAAMGSDLSGRISRTAETQTQQACGMFYEKHTDSSSPPFSHSTGKQQNKSIVVLKKTDVDSFAFLPSCFLLLPYNIEKVNPRIELDSPNTIRNNRCLVGSARLMVKEERTLEGIATFFLKRRGRVLPLQRHEYFALSQ